MGAAGCHRGSEPQRSSVPGRYVSAEKGTEAGDARVLLCRREAGGSPCVSIFVCLSVVVGA